MSEDVTTANRDITSLQPLAQKAATLFFKKCEEKGIKIFATEFQRSQARQDYLYSLGRTRSGNIVTWTKTSNHTSGYAWDIACSPPQNLYDESIIAKAGAVAISLGIIWGGSWKSTPDTPHFEINSSWSYKEEEEVETKDIKIKLDGNVKTVKAINLNGNNYVKLQDLKDNYIDISYDSVAKLPVIDCRASR